MRVGTRELATILRLRHTAMNSLITDLALDLDEARRVLVELRDNDTDGRVLAALVKHGVDLPEDL